MLACVFTQSVTECGELSRILPTRTQRRGNQMFRLLADDSLRSLTFSQRVSVFITNPEKMDLLYRPLPPAADSHNFLVRHLLTTAVFILVKIQGSKPTQQLPSMFGQSWPGQGSSMPGQFSFHTSCEPRPGTHDPCQRPPFEGGSRVVPREQQLCRRSLVKQPRLWGQVRSNRDLGP